MKKISISILVLALGSPMLSRAEEMASQYKPNVERKVCESTRRAADFLVMAQIPSKDGGVGWNWVLGDGSTPDNVAGLIALSLLDAYAATGEEKYLATARRYADGLVERVARFSSERLPFKADVELLARLGGMPQGERYARAARALFEVLRSRSTDGMAEVQRIRLGRASEPALLGFDVALAIRAAQAVGERAYAYQLADSVLAEKQGWYRSKESARFSQVSAGALSLALERLDGGHYRKAIDRLRADLLAAQQPNGAFSENETQPSAYATLSLLAGLTERERRAGLAGLRWLKSTMLRAGGFAHYNDYMPEPFVGQVVSEVNAEVLFALSLACATGQEVD
ncbi:MAG: hypothetical protein GYA21_14170 [Myxococcales bacterium]|nr:hypothetical protein [Myxococcales bacterium]